MPSGNALYPDIEEMWSAEWGGKCLFSHGTSNAWGVMILKNNKFSGKVNVTHMEERLVA